MLVFMKNVHNPDLFSIHLSNRGDITFLFMVQKLSLPLFQCILHVFLRMLYYFKGQDI